jgi:DNA adenine methylase
MAGVLRWHGGKGLIAGRIIPLLPPHLTYVEPFGGAANVLLAKPRSRHEVYNDLNGRLVQFFRVLRDRPEELAEKVALTPYAREEYELSSEPTDDPVESARRFMVASWMTVQGFDGTHDRPTHFRRLVNMTATGRRAPVRQWASVEDRLYAAAQRLRAVQIDRQPAMKIMRDFNRPDVAFYLDPPYPLSTRSSFKRYSHEMTDADHSELLRAARRSRASFVISSYPSPLYARELKGVPFVDVRVVVISANGGRGKGWAKSPRLERLWVLDRSGRRRRGA